MTAIRILCLLILSFGYLQADEPKGPAMADLHLLNPVWQGDTVYSESTVLLQETEGGPLVGRLAFPASEIIEAHSSNRELTLDPKSQIKITAKGTIEIRKIT